MTIVRTILDGATPPATEERLLIDIGTRWRVSTPDINPGAVTGPKIAAGAIDYSKFFTNLRPVEIVGALPALPNATYPSGSVVLLTTDTKLYRTDGATWTTSVTDSDINSLTASKITAGTLTAAVILTGSIKTATSGLRTEMDSAGIRLYGYNAPYIRSVGPDANGTGAVTPTLPPLHKTNDILVLLVETIGSKTAPTTPTGYTKKDEISTGATNTDVRLTVYWKRDGGSESNPTLATTGDRQSAFIAAVAGCTTTGDPFDVTSATSDTNASTSVSAVGGTTTLPNDLVLIGIGFNPTQDLGHILFSAWANSNLQSASEAKESFVDSVGTAWGALGLGHGVKAAVGAIGATTLTLDSASKKAMWVGAMKADIGATVNLDASTGNGSFGGAITGARIYSPRSTGDRSVFGPVPMGTTGYSFPGMGISTYRDADIDGPHFSVAYKPRLDRDQISGGAQSIAEIWAVGSDTSDLSTMKYENPVEAEYALLQIQSGWWHSAIAGGSQSPSFSFSMLHWDSTNALVSGQAILDMIDLSGNVEFRGIKRMRDMFQGGGYTVTFPGASTTTTATTVSYPQAWAAAPTTVTVCGTGGNANVFRTHIYVTGATSASSFTSKGFDILNAQPANGTAVGCAYTAGGPNV